MAADSKNTKDGTVVSSPSVGRDKMSTGAIHQVVGEKERFGWKPEVGPTLHVSGSWMRCANCQREQTKKGKVGRR